MSLWQAIFSLFGLGAARAGALPPAQEAAMTGQLSAHFHEDEFRCRCCGQLHPDGVPQALVELLERVRQHFGAPVTVNSGYRCPAHNKAVGGAVHSQHLLGTAADIRVRGVTPSAVHAYLDPVHEGGLGKYASFTHVDVRMGRARWSG